MEFGRLIPSNSLCRRFLNSTPAYTQLSIMTLWRLSCRGLSSGLTESPCRHPSEDCQILGQENQPPRDSLHVGAITKTYNMLTLLGLPSLQLALPRQNTPDKPQNPHGTSRAISRRLLRTASEQQILNHWMLWVVKDLPRFTTRTDML